MASGSSGACEGNVLAWDKSLERELPLALRSAELWATLAQELDDDFEYDRKGSVVVAETPEELVAAAERLANPRRSRCHRRSARRRRAAPRGAVRCA